MDAKEEVRSRLAIEDVIGEYVPLKRAGRNWKGLSPFSGEKSASFFVSPDKQIWHDFSSNKGGDIFSFVMEVEGIDFRTALEMLARKAGVDLSLYAGAGDKELAQKKQRLYKVLDTAATYYQRSLLGNQSAIDYVVGKRQLDKNVVMGFRLGYAPDHGSALLEAMIKKGFSEQELREAGLVSQRRGGLGDMFRERMMVPLSDGQGQVIGFTARLVRDIEHAPKYINTPQTLLYDKGRHVFGLHQAKEAIRQLDYAVVVEGNLDVISSHQVNVTQVVATAGTALTEHHLKALSRLTHHIRLCFDGDKAGIAATERAIPIAQTVGVELTIVSLPSEFKDPDEVIKHDPSLWQQAIESPQPAVEWIIAQYQKRFDITTAAGKRQLTTEALKIVQALKDPVEQEHYLQRLGEVTGASLKALEGKLSNQEDEVVEKRFKRISVAQNSEHDPKVSQDYLLGLAALDASVHDTLRRLTAGDVAGEERQAVLGYLLAHLGESIAESLPVDLQPYETYVKIVLFKAETRYSAVDSPERLIEAASLVRHIQDEQRTQKKQQLDLALREAEAAHDDEAAQALRTELALLIKEKKRAPRQ
ncbi:DNA primase [Pedobacter sp.]|nr:DNA primase [Candidatus Saccharibacteria bacterium]